MRISIVKYVPCILILSISLLVSNCGYKDNYFRVGQIWKYNNRPGEQNSVITIVSVENDKECGVIVGTSINNINMPYMGEGGVINFIPFSKEALQQSVVSIKGFEEHLPNYKDDYKKWRKKFDAKQCKIVTYSVAQVLDSFQINIQPVTQALDSLKENKSKVK